MSKLKSGGIVKPNFKLELIAIDGIPVYINANSEEIVITKEQAAKMAQLAAIPFPEDAPVISAKELKNIAK